ncbi:MAG TPA: hypothetical protein VHQ64_03865 [Pyrinomonadaceae bacterium]|jgi:hypothetical protein|nr:hypothetical protein [Pyrinomonadaceae bacterium]
MKDFLIQFAAGFGANIITALLLYVLIDRRIRQKERDEQRREQERAESVRARENANLQRATLLQQFPPLMQRLVDIQRDAFAASLLSCDGTGATTPLRTLASNLRHFANVHLDTVSTLASLGADVEEMNYHANLTNEIAIISLCLIRNINAGGLASSVKRSLKRVTECYDPKSRGASHLERMHLLLGDLDKMLKGFSVAGQESNHTLFCSLAEAVGHNTNLLLERVNEAFDRELSMLRHDCLPNNPSKLNAERLLAER